jgi:DNA modification methylase
MKETQFERVSLKKLKEAEYNPRIIDPGKLELLKKSLKEDIEFLNVRPVIVNMYPGREYIVVGGNMRVKAARELGYKDIPCIFINIEPIREKAWNIKDNQSYGSWETQLLKESMIQLKEENYDLSLIGFSEDEIKLILGEENLNFQPPEEADESHTAPSIKTNIKLGDIIKVGKHTILCGDSTKSADVDKLIGNSKPQLLITSPPYGVGIEYEKKSEEQLKKLLSGFIKAYASHLNTLVINFANIKCCENGWQFDTAGWLNQEALSNGYNLLDCRIWKKPKNMGTPPYWLYSHKSMDEWEFINIYQKVKKYKNNLTKEENNEFGFAGVWEMPNAAGEAYHPAKFPIILPYQAIKMTTAEGETVVDPFAGSMTTLLAAEQLNRVSLCMELEPKYIQHSLYRIRKYFPDIEITEITSDKDLLLDKVVLDTTPVS